MAAEFKKEREGEEIHRAIRAIAAYFDGKGETE